MITSKEYYQNHGHYAFGHGQWLFCSKKNRDNVLAIHDNYLTAEKKAINFFGQDCEIILLP